MRPGALERRAYIGALPFVSNVVILQRSLARLTTIPGLPDVIKQGAKSAHDKVQGLVDRRGRHTIEHIDQPAADAASRSLVSSTFVEGAPYVRPETMDPSERWRSAEKSSTRWRLRWIAFSGRRKPWIGCRLGGREGGPLRWQVFRWPTGCRRMAAGLSAPGSALRVWPDEPTALQPLGVERHAHAVMPEDLAQAARAAAEDEQVSAMGISLEALLDDQGQALHPLPHVRVT